MHPEDAASLGLVDGQRVLITSEYGSVKMKLRIVNDEAIIQGCVHSLHGFPQDNINNVTPDLENDPISGFPALKSFPVRVCGAE
jgi:anaerobic selenocysteine-containing dehydrogenase